MHLASRSLMVVVSGVLGGLLLPALPARAYYSDAGVNLAFWGGVAITQSGSAPSGSVLIDKYRKDPLWNPTGAADGSQVHWFQLDLGSAQNVFRVAMAETGNWSSAYFTQNATQYKIWVGDTPALFGDGTLGTVAPVISYSQGSGAGPSSTNDLFASTPGRYVRVELEKNGGAGNYGVVGLQVYSKDAKIVDPAKYPISELHSGGSSYTVLSGTWHCRSTPDSLGASPLLYEYASSDQDQSAASGEWQYRRTQVDATAGTSALQLNLPMLYAVSGFKLSYLNNASFVPDSIAIALSSDGGASWGSPVFTGTPSAALNLFSGSWAPAWANAVKLTVNDASNQSLLYRFDIFGVPEPATLALLALGVLVLLKRQRKP